MVLSRRSSPRKRGPRLGDVRVHRALKTRVNALVAPGSPLPRGRTELMARVSKTSLGEQAVQHRRSRQLTPKHAIVLLGDAEQGVDGVHNRADSQIVLDVEAGGPIGSR